MILLALTKKFDGEHEEMEDLMARTLEAQKLAKIAVEAASDTRATNRWMA